MTVAGLHTGLRRLCEHNFQNIRKLLHYAGINGAKKGNNFRSIVFLYNAHQYLHAPTSSSYQSSLVLSNMSGTTGNSSLSLSSSSCRSEEDSDSCDLYWNVSSLPLHFTQKKNSPPTGKRRCKGPVASEVTPSQRVREEPFMVALLQIL